MAGMYGRQDFGKVQVGPTKSTTQAPVTQKRMNN
jgi:hypothetical protein